MFSSKRAFLQAETLLAARAIISHTPGTGIINDPVSRMFGLGIERELAFVVASTRALSIFTAQS